MKYIKLGDVITTLYKYFPLSFERQNAEDDLKSIPTEDVKKVRHGKWVERNGMFYCSECGHAKPHYLNDPPFEVVFWDCNYCLNCGTKMDE